jgi:hypothetical protein
MINIEERMPIAEKILSRAGSAIPGEIVEPNGGLEPILDPLADQLGPLLESLTGLLVGVDGLLSGVNELVDPFIKLVELLMSPVEWICDLFP